MRFLCANSSPWDDKSVQVDFNAVAAARLTAGSVVGRVLPETVIARRFAKSLDSYGRGKKCHIGRGWHKRLPAA